MDMYQWALALTVALPFLGVLFILLFKRTPRKGSATVRASAHWSPLYPPVQEPPGCP